MRSALLHGRLAPGGAALGKYRPRP